jgi:hypothetical protein
MTTLTVIARLQTRFGGFFFASSKYEVTIYFDGPRTKFGRSTRSWTFEEWRECVRTPIDDNDVPMPAPHVSELVATKQFRTRAGALCWAVLKCEGLANIKADVRPI